MVVTSKASAPTGWRGEFGRLFALAWPLVVAQVAQSALLTTDVIMTGWLGPEFLAASTLAMAFLNTLLVAGLGFVGVVTQLVAQGRGARDMRAVRRTVRAGLWVALALALVLTAIIWQVRPIFLAIGQDPALISRIEEFLHIAAFLIIPALLLTVLRSFLAAYGDTRVILVITVVGVFANMLFNYTLMFGNFGFPRLELRGSAISTLAVNTLMFLMFLLYISTHRRFRRFHLFARLFEVDWSRIAQILRIGGPIGLLLLAEVGLFGAASLMMGWLGTNEVAAHAVALQCTALTFMVPLGVSQATTVRVGLAYGARSAAGVRRAGWAGLVMSLIFMCSTALAFLLIPGLIVGLFLNPNAPENQTALVLATSYLAIAGAFQLVDGAQVSSAAALRGLNDTRMPLVIALIGYWVVGAPVAYFLAFNLGLRGAGIWYGLASGLAFVAVAMTVRFALRERLRLVPQTMLAE